MQVPNPHYEPNKVHKPKNNSRCCGCCSCSQQKSSETKNPEKIKKSCCLRYDSGHKS